MRFNLRERVLLAGLPGMIAAVVRADDDPRKCVPSGKRFILRGDIPERDGPTYLVQLDDGGPLIWSYRKALTPMLPLPSSVRPAASPRSCSIAGDAQAISDGTMASLTGFDDTAALWRARQEFTQFVIGAESCGTRYASWIDAWRWFVNGSFGDRMPAYNDVERLYVRVRAGERPRSGVVWESPDRMEWISADEAPFTLEEGQRDGLFGQPGWTLIRVGFVGRHWMVGRQRDRFLAWVAGFGATQKATGAVRCAVGAAGQ